jgi:hypothetical protein
VSNDSARRGLTSSGPIPRGLTSSERIAERLAVVPAPDEASERRVLISIVRSVKLSLSAIGQTVDPPLFRLPSLLPISTGGCFS